MAESTTKSNDLISYPDAAHFGNTTDWTRDPLPHNNRAQHVIYSNEPPDGGLQAWMFVLSGFWVFFATFGLLNSYGTFQTYYKETLMPSMSESNISWIGSVQAFLLYSLGVIFGSIFDKYGPRVLTIPGTIIFDIALMTSSLCNKYWQLMLTQGILFGIGNSMLFYPTIFCIPFHFKRRRALAVSIIVSGSAVGGICWPLAIKTMLSQVGFPWTMRILGFIVLAILVPSCAFISRKYVPETQGSPNATGHERFIQDNANAIKEANNRVKEIFSDKRYTVFTAGMFFVMWAVFIPYYYIPSYGLDVGLSTTLSYSALAFLNGGSLLGRILTGFLADRCGRFNTIILMATLSGVILFLVNAMYNKAGIIVFATLYGVFSGGLISLPAACVSQITPDIKIIGLKVGMMMSICSLGILAGGPLGGAIYKCYTKGLVDFSAGIFVIGLVFLIMSRLLGKREVWATF